MSNAIYSVKVATTRGNIIYKFDDEGEAQLFAVYARSEGYGCKSRFSAEKVFGTKDVALDDLRSFAAPTQAEASEVPADE